MKLFSKQLASSSPNWSLQPIPLWHTGNVIIWTLALIQTSVFNSPAVERFRVCLTKSVLIDRACLLKGKGFWIFFPPICEGSYSENCVFLIWFVIVLTMLRFINCIKNEAERREQNWIYKINLTVFWVDLSVAWLTPVLSAFSDGSSILNHLYPICWEISTGRGVHLINRYQSRQVTILSGADVLFTKMVWKPDC